MDFGLYNFWYKVIKSPPSWKWQMLSKSENFVINMMIVGSGGWGNWHTHSIRGTLCTVVRGGGWTRLPTIAPGFLSRWTEIHQTKITSSHNFRYTLYYECSLMTKQKRNTLQLSVHAIPGSSLNFGSARATKMFASGVIPQPQITQSW